MNDFTIYLLMAPFLAVAFGLAMFWLTGWLDRREERRRHAAE
jgi:NhaP-type Na+/H+ or K+/H+ antiporter